MRARADGVREPLLIPEIYRRAKRPVISFEVFPPKNDEAHRHLLAILPELAELGPDFMTVTYGAMGTTRDRTVEIAAFIQNKFGIPTASHLTCVGSSRTELDRIVQQIRGAGIRNVVALRGDPPKGETEFIPPPDGFGHANELVAHIRRQEGERGLDRLGVAVAGYPEKHLEAPDMATDLTNLKRKVESGADCVITQLFYDNQVYFKFVRNVRQLGFDAPVAPGLLPIVSAKQIVRITAMCGASLPGELRSELEAVGDDPEKAEEIGVRQSVAQANELLENGAPGIHFYVLNKSSHIKRIMLRISRG